MSIRGDFQAIVRSLMPPTAPPPTGMAQRRAGLSLLDAGLGLDHVLRVTEALTLENQNFLSRETTIDVDTEVIRLQQHAGLGHNEAVQLGPHVWIPIARHPREDLAPIFVRNQTGDAVLRMSYRQSVDLVCAGVLEIFDRIYTSEVARSLPESLPRRIDDRGRRAKWLIQRALVELLIRGGASGFVEFSKIGDRCLSNVQEEDLYDWADSTARQGSRSILYDVEEIRSSAISLFDSLFRSDHDPFVELLEIVSRDYFIVVSSPIDVGYVSYTFSAPPLRASAPEGAHRRSGPIRRLKRGLSLGQEFHVSYSGAISNSIRSYHLTLSVDPDIRIRDCVMITDEDAAESAYLSDSLSALSEWLPPSSAFVGRHGLPPSTAQEKLTEHELQSLMARLRILLRSKTSQSSDRDAMPSAIGTATEGGVTDHEKETERLLAILRLSLDGKLPNLRTVPQVASTEGANETARLVRDLELGKSVTFDNDPREHVAHLAWNRPGGSGSSSTRGAVSVDVTATMVDDLPSLSDSVRLLLAGLVALTFVCGSAILGGLLWVFQPSLSAAKSSNADAIVAVLLLVPGLLIARIQFPDVQSVAGYLRTFPRRIAFLAVGTTTSLAAVIAASKQFPTLILQVAEWVLIILLVLSHLDIQRRRERRSRPEFLPHGIPAWLSLLRRLPSAPDERLDVAFRAVHRGGRG